MCVCLSVSQVAAGPVPPSMLVPVPMLSPMLPANWESRTDKCFIATGLKNVVRCHACMHAQVHV